jgi:hypothetical protein
MMKPEVESMTKTGSAWFIRSFSQISQINWAMLRPRVEKTVNGNNFLSLTRWRQRFLVTDGHWSLTRAPQL